MSGVEKIYDANDRAVDFGFADAADYLRRGHALTPDGPKWGGKVCGGPPVWACVNKSRWIAYCECGGAEWVAPGVPFYCRSCGNVKTEGKARPVEWPQAKAEIEAELLLREVMVPQFGKRFTNRLVVAVPVTPELDQNWMPGESVEALRMQREVMSGMMNAEG